MAHKVSDSVM
jgi:hypothetical protein